jgi:hypothetical protein
MRQQAGRRPMAPQAASQAAPQQAGWGQPAVRQPSARRPAGARTAAGQAAAGQVTVREPAVRQPGIGRPATAQPGLGRPAGQPAGGRPDARQAPGLAPVTAARVPRTRFILLVLGMLGGGLVCLLVINTTLATASFRINALQHGNAALAQQEQTLQQQVATEESPSSLERQARKLGLRTQPLLNVLNLRTGRIFRQPASQPGIPNVPGYAP